MTRPSRSRLRRPARTWLALALAGSALCTPSFAQSTPPAGKTPAASPAASDAAGKPAASPAGSADAGRAPAKSFDVKTDEAKMDAPKSDAPKSDAPKTDAPKADGTKAAAPVDPRQAQQQDREAFFDAHLAALHAGLTLTGEQEPLWAPVEAAIRALEKTRHPRRTREEIAGLLDQSPSDLLRMRGEQLTRRGEALRQLAEAASPLVDKLDDAQKRRLPYLLEGMRPAPVLRAAFDIRDGRVDDGPQGQEDGRAAGGPDDRARGRFGDDMPDGGRQDRYRRQGFEPRQTMPRPQDSFEMGDDRS